MNIDEKKVKPVEEDSEEGGTGSSGGQTGEVNFRYSDAMSVQQRDDLLSPEEVRRLLVVHKDIHKERVDKQKLTRKERKALKEGHMDLIKTIYNQPGIRGAGNGQPSNYKTHPIAIKFSGIRDLKMSPFASENTGEANMDKKNELQNRNENKLQNQYRPERKFTPKPRPY